MISADVIQEVRVLNGTYTPSEARDILTSIIDNQINFYKLQHLSQWERNHNISGETVDDKINKLTHQKHELMEIINQARRQGLHITLGGSLELSIER